MVGLQQCLGCVGPLAQPSPLRQVVGHQGQVLGRMTDQLFQGFERPGGVTERLAQTRQLDPGPGRFRAALGQRLQLCQGLAGLAALMQRLGLFAEVMGPSQAERTLVAGVVQPFGHLRGPLPVPGAFVDRQQGQLRFGFEGGALEPEQGRFGPVKQTGFQEIECEGVLRPFAVPGRQVAPLQQVLMDPHGAVVIAPAAEQVAQGEMELGRVGVALDGLDERIDGLVLLLVEQVVQATEIGLRVLPAVQAPLFEVDAGGQPAQGKRDRQAPQQPREVKFHAEMYRVVCLRRAGLRQVWTGNLCGRGGHAARSAASRQCPGRCRASWRPAAPAPGGPATGHRKTGAGPPVPGCSGRKRTAQKKWPP